MGARRYFSRARGGNVIIEFALLAPIFFMSVVGLIEFVLYQYKTYALNHVVYEAARNLQTGEVQNSDDMDEAFRTEACLHASGLINCGDIRFDVRSFVALADVNFQAPVFDENGNPTNFVFLPGGPSEYSVVRAAIHHEFVTPFMAELFGMGPDLPAIVNAYVVVKNEPWT
jgi:Flp pilus assembly protein TadG